MTVFLDFEMIRSDGSPWLTLLEEEFPDSNTDNRPWVVPLHSLLFGEAGFQITVDHTLLMGGFEGLGDLEGKFQGFFNGNGSPFQAVCQRITFDKLQNKEVGSV